MVASSSSVASPEFGILMCNAGEQAGEDENQENGTDECGAQRRAELTEGVEHTGRVSGMLFVHGREGEVGDLGEDDTNPDAKEHAAGMMSGIVVESEKTSRIAAAPPPMASKSPLTSSHFWDTNAERRAPPDGEEKDHHRHGQKGEAGLKGACTGY